MSDKSQVIELLARLPDEMSLKKIKEEIDILVALQQAEDELDAGQGIPHDEIEAKVASWFGR